MEDQKSAPIDAILDYDLNQNKLINKYFFYENFPIPNF